MAYTFKFNNNNVDNIVFNNQPVTKIVKDGVVVWEKQSAITYHWNGYNVGNVYTLQCTATGTSTTNTTRWGKMIAVSNVDSVRSGGNLVDGKVVSTSQPTFDFTNVGGGDMPTSTGSYSGYFVAANTNGIKLGSPITTAPAVGSVTSYSSLFNISFTYKADIVQYMPNGEQYKLNNTVVTTAESQDPNAYPDHGVKDGYWWEKA